MRRNRPPACCDLRASPLPALCPAAVVGTVMPRHTCWNQAPTRDAVAVSLFHQGSNCTGGEVSGPVECGSFPTRLRYVRRRRWGFVDPTIWLLFGDAIFPPQWAGTLFAVNRQKGQLIWSHQISHCTGPAGSIARTSVAIHGDEAILRDTEASIPSREGPHITAVKRKTEAAARALPACQANAPRRWATSD